MDGLIILAAFACGFTARQINQPPWWATWWRASAWVSGFQSSAGIGLIANAGISMMLFIIGLKLDIKSLLRPEIYRATIEHTLSFGFISFCLLLFVGTLGLPLVSDITLQQAALVAFALSFQFDRMCRGHSGRSRRIQGPPRPGRRGHTDRQDIVAVLFLTISMGKVPTLGAAATAAVLCPPAVRLPVARQWPRRGADTGRHYSHLRRQFAVRVRRGQGGPRRTGLRHADQRRQESGGTRQVHASVSRIFS